LTYETLLLEKRDGVGIITLNRPDRLNALSITLFAEFDQALTQFEDDDEVKVLVVTGSGEKAFSAGADIHEMAKLPEERLEERNVRRTDWTWHLASFRKPTIGAINGLAYGGGALMASAFDIRIGCERSRFRYVAVTYSRVNSTWTLPVAVGWPMAKELLFTGRVVEAEEAHRIGLLNKLVSSAELMKTTIEMGQLIAGNDSAAVRAIKEITVSDIGLSFQNMQRNEAEIVARLVNSPPPKDSFSDFLKRKSH